jgi:hypothetical protein
MAVKLLVPPALLFSISIDKVIEPVELVGALQRRWTQRDR